MYESRFFMNLEKFATTGVVLSWAVPGQAGLGHVNTRDSAYVRGKMAELGFEMMLEPTVAGRNSSQWPWFKDTFQARGPSDRLREAGPGSPPDSMPCLNLPPHESMRW